MSKDILKTLPPRRYKRLMKILKLKVDLERFRELKKAMQPPEKILPS